MLSPRDLVRRLKECKEEEEGKEEVHEAREQNDLGTSGWDWREGTEGKRKKIQIQTHLNQERYQLNISNNSNQ